MKGGDLLIWKISYTLMILCFFLALFSHTINAGETITSAFYGATLAFVVINFCLLYMPPKLKP